MNRPDILENLNEAQRRAVTHIDGPMLTLAGPGSGKTRVVTHRIAYMLENGISPYSILALTFTNKAAQEMKARLGRIVEDAPVWMGTFHGYCARFLRHYGRMVGLAENFTIFDMDDAKAAMQHAIVAADVSLTHLKFNDIARGISDLKNRVVAPEMMQGERLSSNDKILGKVYNAYQKLLVQNNAVDFDDLLMHTASILRSSPELRKDLDSKHRYILVDEYQDTNLAQYLIVRALSIDYPNLNVTGDPDQSIYGWRGADISNILNFERDYPNVVTVRLEQNYRSTPEILSVADALISCNSRRKAKLLIPTLPSGVRVRLCSYRSGREEADMITDQIASAIIEGAAKPNDFAILYRTNAHSRLLEQALLRKKLNYQLIGGFRFYHREEIKDLLAYLRLVNNPTDDIAFERVVNVPTRGLGDKSLQKVTEFARMKEIPMLVALRAAVENSMLSKKACSGARQFLQLYDQLVHLCSGSLVEMLEHLVKQTDYVNYLARKKTESPDESIQGNINELLSDALEVDKVAEPGHAIEQFLEQVSLLSDADALEDNDNRVKLMTLHSAKGLEFDYVYVIAVEQEILPHIRAMRDPAQMEEERRLLFVGITRAKKQLQLSNAAMRGFGDSKMSSPSPFLLELPRAEMEIVDYSDRSFEDFDSDDGFDNEWPSQSFLHEKRRKGVAPKKRPIVDSDSSFSDESDSSWDVLQDFGNDDSQQVSQSESFSDDLEFVDRSEDPSQRKQAIAKLNAAMNQQLPRSLKAASQIASASTLKGIAVEEFFEGCRVLHPTYGEGLVLSLDGRGPKRVARISFGDGETKSFQLNKSPLEILY